MDTVKCYHCQKPAMYTIGEQNIPLCLDCYFKVFQMQQAEIENAERQTNYWSAVMDEQIGFSAHSARFPERKTVHVGGIALNNIKVDNSIIGSINTGIIGSIDIAITSIKGTNPQVADALTQLSQTIIANQTLNKEMKDECLEILSALATEVATPKERQRKSMSRTLLSRLQELISVASDLTTIWSTWGPVLLAAFTN